MNAAGESSLAAVPLILAASNRSPGAGGLPISNIVPKGERNLCVNMREAEFCICSSLLNGTALEEDRGVREGLPQNFG
jgi:hypothetical protein